MKSGAPSAGMSFAWTGTTTRRCTAPMRKPGGAMGGGKPIMVIADTVKGKGVSFMEHSVLWHYRTARGEEYEAALKELEAGKP